MTATHEVAARSSALGTVRPRVGWPPASRPRLWRGLHLLSLVAAAVALGFFGRNQWFWVDDWNFILDRVETPTLGLFTPHNEHWSTIPILIYRALYATVGLDSYMPYLAVLIVLHLLLTHLLWRVSMRAGADPATATAVAGVFAVLGAGAENLLWAFQIGFVGALACGWLAVLLHDHDGPFGRRDLLGWAATTTALMLTGVGIAFVGITALTVGLRRRRLSDVVLVAAVPAAVFVGWWAMVGRHHTNLASSDKVRVLRFAWHGVANMADQVVGISGIGWLLVIGLGWWWVRHRGDAAGPAAPAAAGFVGMFAFFLLTGNGRVPFGLVVAESSRYVYAGAALLAPSVALVLSRAVPPATWARGVVGGLFALAALHNLHLLRERVAVEVGPEQAVKRQLAAHAAVLEDDDPVVEDPKALLVGMFGSGYLYPDDLRRLLDDGWDPSAETSRREQLDAELLWQVGLEPPDPDDDLAAVPFTGAHVAVEPTSAAACVAVRSLRSGGRLAFPPGPDGLRVRLTAPQLVVIGVELRDRGVSAGPSELVVGTGETWDLLSYADARTLVLIPPVGQDITVCGIDPTDDPVA